MSQSQHNLLGAQTVIEREKVNPDLLAEVSGADGFSDFLLGGKKKKRKKLDKILMQQHL